MKCARCGESIEPDEPWDLDHDNSRLFYLGPSHAYCNRERVAYVAGLVRPTRDPAQPASVEPILSGLDDAANVQRISV